MQSEVAKLAFKARSFCLKPTFTIDLQSSLQLDIDSEEKFMWKSSQNL